MKTILRIIVILIVAAFVAGAFSLTVNNTSISAGSTGEEGQAPMVTSADGQSFQPGERPTGGDEGAGSLTQGLSGVLATLMKIAGITVLVLLFQKASNQLGRLMWKFAQQ